MGRAVSKNNIRRILEMERETAKERAKAKASATPAKNLFKGLTPDEKKALYTVAALDAFLKDKLQSHFIDEKVATTHKIYLREYFKENCPADPICNWETMESSGAGSDCLIHTFLTATCGSFRRLTKPFKDAVARSFRHHIYGASEQVQAILRPPTPRLTIERNRTRIFRGEFLDDSDLGRLTDMYKIPCLVFESGKSAEVTQYDNPSKKSDATLVQKRMYMPSIAQLVGPENPDPVYLLSNRGNMHYESVRTNTGSYTISREDANAILQRLGLGLTVTRECAYEVGDDVLFNGEMYIVLEVRYNDDAQKCNELRLTDNRGYKEYDSMDKNVRNLTATLDRLTKHRVEPDKVSVPPKGGYSRRRTRRSKVSRRFTYKNGRLSLRSTH